MRKVALLAAIALTASVASLSFSIPAAAQDVQTLNRDTGLFVKDLFNPYGASATPAAPAAKVARKKKSRK